MVLLIVDLTGIAKKLFNTYVTDWTLEVDAGEVMTFSGKDGAGFRIELIISTKAQMVRANYSEPPRKTLIVSFDELPGLTHINRH